MSGELRPHEIIQADSVDGSMRKFSFTPSFSMHLQGILQHLYDDALLDFKGMCAIML